MFNIFGDVKISNRYNSTDREQIWQSWAQERAYRNGLMLSSAALVLSIAAIIINFFYLGPFEVFADFILFLGCAASLVLTRRRAEKRYFVWWPMYFGYWFAIQPNTWVTGGVSSPFFSSFMILLLVGAVVIQTEVRLRHVVTFVLVNILFWSVLAYIHPLTSDVHFPLTYNVLLNADCIIAVAVCLYGFLKTEKDLAREFEQRYVELQAAQKSLEKEETANATKSAFLANISHELRTPLGAILGYIDLLLDENYSETERKDQLSIVKRNGLQLSRLVDDLLDLSKIEAGRLEIERLQVDPELLLTDIYETFSLAASKKSLLFNIKFLNPIPKSVELDPVRLKQILVNLIGNAIKFTDEGRVEVHVEYLDSIQQLKFSVRDSGRGLTREEQEKLFQPFSQADVSVSRKYGGTGLGLNLSRQLVRLMGGDLKLSFSRPGEGSIFTFWVDALGASDILTSEFVASQPALAATKQEINPNTSQLPLLGVKVLVVDDTVDNRSLIRTLLELAGAQVETAEDGTEGIRKTLDQTFDLVLMDIQMPGLDGLQATSLLRQRNYRKPIVALTAHAMKQDRERCLEAGCTDYLAKPIQRKELIATIERLVSKQKNNPVVSLRSEN